MVNQELAGIFYELAFYLEMENIPFKPQAYRKAALFLESLNQDAEDIYRREGKEGLEKIPGVGKGMAQKIIEYLKTGKISEYEKFKKKIPVNLKELTSIEGIGPKAVRDLYKYLKIKNLAQLEQAALKGKIRKLPNFGEKSEKNILEAVNFIKKSQGRFFLDEAWRLADKIVFQLESLKEVEKVSVAGSLRRMKETIGDIDLLATIKKKVLVSEALAKEGNKKIMDVFTRLDGVIKIWDYGFKKSSVRFYEGIDVDLRVVTSNESGSALQYFTGSKEHNIITRKLALEKGLKLNEYGVFKGKKRVAGKTEEEIYKIIGLPYIEPELRENTGEIEAGLKNQLPKIIGYNEIKGDLHCHSDWDGGEDSIEEMAKAAQEMGYEYIGISDHTKFLKIEHGLDENQLLEQHKAIERLNRKMQDVKCKIRVLHGCEANILEDGRLDIDEKILAKLDYVIAGIHSQMKMPKEKMNERLIRAMKNPLVKIISHPTGRLIQRRDEYQIDFEKVLNAALETRTALEVNSYPQRLDLKDSNIRKAVEKGVKICVNTDAHQKDQMKFIKFGIAQARRGWAGKDDIINSWPIKKLLEFFKN